MKHTHKYESILHPALSKEAASLGITGAELRKCETCGKETLYVNTRKEGWFSILADEEASEKDILMA